MSIDRERYDGALAKYRSHGGRAVKVGDDWEHRCKDCAHG